MPVSDLIEAESVAKEQHSSHSEEDKDWKQTRIRQVPAITKEIRLERANRVIDLPSQGHIMKSIWTDTCECLCSVWLNRSVEDAKEYLQLHKHK